MDIAKLAEKHSGTVTASNGTQHRVIFPIATRAAGFYDQAFGNVAQLDWTPGSKTIIVTE